MHSKFLAFASLSLLLPLGGCPSFAPTYDAAAASALTTIHNTEDRNIRAWMVDACGTPLSAIIRNPQIAPALQKLCPGAESAGVAPILDKIESPTK